METMEISDLEAFSSEEWAKIAVVRWQVIYDTEKMIVSQTDFTNTFV